MGSNAPPGYMRLDASLSSPRRLSASAMATNLTATMVPMSKGTVVPKYVALPPLTAHSWASYQLP